MASCWIPCRPAGFWQGQPHDQDSSDTMAAFLPFLQSPPLPAECWSTRWTDTTSACRPSGPCASCARCEPSTGFPVSLILISLSALEKSPLHLLLGLPGRVLKLLGFFKLNSGCLVKALTLVFCQNYVQLRRDKSLTTFGQNLEVIASDERGGRHGIFGAAFTVK